MGTYEGRILKKLWQAVICDTTTNAVRYSKPSELKANVDVLLSWLIFLPALIIMSSRKKESSSTLNASRINSCRETFSVA